MDESAFRLGYRDCLETLARRVAEPAPGRIQLLSGPRQVGKTTLLLELAERLGRAGTYVAADAPEAAFPGSWERLWLRIGTQARVASGRPAVVLLDEVQHVPDWAARLKGVWDGLQRQKSRVHIIASGSSALRLGAGSRESLAGRFERLTLAHWSAAGLVEAFRLSREQAVRTLVRTGSYPGTISLRRDPARLLAYVRDAIIEPAVGRDLLALGTVRRPALLRHLFAACASLPAQIISLQKLQAVLHDGSALETIAGYLALLEQALLIVPLEKHTSRPFRRRAAPPKIVVLNNALLAAADPRGIPEVTTDPARFGTWVENACLAHAWNAGQRVAYWREEPWEVDGVIEGSWGRWAIEVKTSTFEPAGLRGLLEFQRRFPAYRPLVVCRGEDRAAAENAGVDAIAWPDFLLAGPPGTSKTVP